MTWLTPTQCEAHGLPPITSVDAVPGTYTLERAVLRFADAPPMLAERARAGARRDPLAAHRAVAKLLAGRTDLPVSLSRRVEGPRPVLLRPLLSGEPVDDENEASAIVQVLRSLSNTMSFTPAVHAERDRFVAARSWHAVLTEEIELTRAVLARTVLHGRPDVIEVFARATTAFAAAPEPLDLHLVHGNLSGAHIRMQGEDIVEITGWDSALLGDPLTDVGTVLHLPCGAEVCAAMPEVVAQPNARERLAVGFYLSAVRTVATLAGGLVDDDEIRSGQLERIRCFIAHVLTVGPDARLDGAGSPLPPDPDLAVLARMADVLGSIPSLDGDAALPLAAVLACLEIAQSGHREEAIQAVRGLLGRFDGRIGLGGTDSPPPDALARIEALRPDGRVRAFCGARVVRSVCEGLGDATPRSALGGAQRWLCALEPITDQPRGRIEELCDAVIQAWAVPAHADGLRIHVLELLEGLPRDATLTEPAATALGRAPTEPHAPLVVAGMRSLGFDDLDIGRVLAALFSISADDS